MLTWSEGISIPQNREDMGQRKSYEGHGDWHVDIEPEPEPTQELEVQGQILEKAFRFFDQFQRRLVVIGLSKFKLRFQGRRLWEGLRLLSPGAVKRDDH